jgi:hypothetical protein
VLLITARCGTRAQFPVRRCGWPASSSMDRERKVDLLVDNELKAVTGGMMNRLFSLQKAENRALH